MWTELPDGMEICYNISATSRAMWQWSIHRTCFLCLSTIFFTKFPVNNCHTSFVAGLCTSIQSFVLDSTNFPLIKSFVFGTADMLRLHATMAVRARFIKTSPYETNGEVYYNQTGLHNKDDTISSSREMPCSLIQNRILLVSPMRTSSITWQKNCPSDKHEHEDSGLLGCNTATLDKWLLTFGGNGEPSSSRVKQPDPEDDGTTILGNIKCHSPNNTASHQRRPESSVTLLWKP